MHDNEQNILDCFEAWAFNTPRDDKVEPEYVIDYLEKNSASTEYLQELKAMTEQVVQVNIDRIIDEGDKVTPTYFPELEKIIRLCEEKLS